MILCTFSWPTQIHLSMPTGAAFYFHHGGRGVYIECKTMDGARLFSYTGEEYSWLKTGGDVEGYHIYEQGSHGKRPPIRKVYFNKTEAAFKGGIIDPVKYTVFLISFEIESVDELANESKQTELRAWIESAVHHFIDLYRLIRKEKDLVRPRINESPILDIFVAEEYRFDEVLVEGEAHLYTRIHNFVDAAKFDQGKKQMTAQELDTLGTFLRLDAPIAMSSKLLLDSKEQTFMRGEHDLAILIAETAFEINLQERLTTWCAANGQTTIRARRGGEEKDVPYQEVVESASVSENLKYAQQFTGKNLKGGSEYRDWQRYAYGKRNAIIHSGARGASAGDANKAFGAVVTFINFINRSFGLA